MTTHSLQVYVEIPPSPLDLSKYQPWSSFRTNCLEHGSIKRKASLNTDNLHAKKSKHEPSIPFPFFPSACKKRCAAKFCNSCLKNRYGEGMNNDGHILKPSGHPEGIGDVFKCPKCRDICNCAQCRKLKEVEPTGNLAHKTGASAAQILNENPVIEGITPDKGKQVENKLTIKNKTSSRHPSEYKKATMSSSSMPVPLPNWKRLCISLDPSVVEDRIYVREFMLRFGRVMNPAISKSHMEELELIGGGYRGRDEFENMPLWVSESCVKSMILGLLGLLITKCHNPEAIKSSIKEIRAMGANLNKIWSVLQSLRNATQSIADSSIRHERMYLVFPDPFPPPASATIRQTRSVRNAQCNFYIISSGQLIPVLTALIDIAATTNTIREEIDTGLKEAKEFSRRSKDAIRLENERWENARKAMLDKENNRSSGQYKLLRDTHKQRLLSIDNAIEIISSYYAVRFKGLLGKDDQGRVYWALYPRIEEITAAHDFLMAISCEKPSEDKGSIRKPRKEQLGAEARLHKDFKEWSSFIAVWGRAPKENKQKTVDHEDTEDDDTEEKWWTFDDAAEIKKLATWLGGRDEDSEKKEILSKRLIQFADSLEWRGRVNRYALPN